MSSSLLFMKLVGAGNDFIAVDNRRKRLGDMAALAARVCDRRRSVGADGLLVVEPSDRTDFRMRYFNRDGSEASMCGNGARCIARFARRRGICGNRTVFETRAGIQRAVLRPDEVELSMPMVSQARTGIRLPLRGVIRTAHWIDTGVPHAVVMVPGVRKIDVEHLGPAIRSHRVFGSAGANVNFVQVLGPHRLSLRTYERGVEGETLACGTGAVAAACIAVLIGRVTSPVRIMTRSGQELRVAFRRAGQVFQDVTLTGEARVICEGTLVL